MFPWLRDSCARPSYSFLLPLPTSQTPRLFSSRLGVFLVLHLEKVGLGGEKKAGEGGREGGGGKGADGRTDGNEREMGARRKRANEETSRVCTFHGPPIPPVFTEQTICFSHSPFSQSPTLSIFSSHPGARRTCQGEWGKTFPHGGTNFSMKPLQPFAWLWWVRPPRSLYSGGGPGGLFLISTKKGAVG